jgi:tripartite-type tricarboxylate transporter receptor subunit TctC
MNIKPIAHLFITLTAALTFNAAASESYPSKAVTWVVPYPPGGTTDVVARTIAKRMSEELGTSIVVENKAGAGGQIAMAAVARAPKDGYTLLVSDASVATASSLYKDMQINPLEDLSPVSLFVTVPHALVVNPKLPVSTIEELKTLSLDAGNSLDFGSGGVGSPLHLAGEAIRLDTGIKWTHIPYKGAKPAILAAMSGEVDVATPSLPSALPQINASALKALAVTSEERIPLLPNVPTMAELGYPNATVFGWVGLHAPAGTPADVIKALETAASVAMKDPSVQKAMTQSGGAVSFKGSSQYNTLVQQQADKWKKIVAQAGLQAR